MANVKMDTQSQAMLISATGTASTVIPAKVNHVKTVFETLEKEYHTKQRTRFLDNLAEVKKRLNAITAVIEEEQKIVKKKREELIAREGKDIFKNIEVKPATVSTADLC